MLEHEFSDSVAVEQIDGNSIVSNRLVAGGLGKRSDRHQQPDIVRAKAATDLLNFGSPDGACRPPLRLHGDGAPNHAIDYKLAPDIDSLVS